jgi:SAM-dependent methyltransferase
LGHAPEKCILCDGTDRTLLFRQNEWTVFLCTGCGLGVLDPRPGASEMEDFYRESYFRSHFGEGIRAGTPELRQRLSQESHRIRFFHGLKKKGRILDIGCGMGYFLAACRDWGYEVEGMDISPEASRFAREELKIPVQTGSGGAIRLDRESFDVITMWHFLEHCPDPHEHLGKAFDWLKKDGLLVIEVPNYSGHDAKKMGQRWRQWDLPYHLFHFTPASLNRLIQQHGFEKRREKYYSSEHVKERVQALSGSAFLGRTIARFYSGHGYAVIASKRK